MAFVKVQFGDTTLAFNPLGKDADIKGPRFGADVALVSVKDKNYNGIENLSFGEKAPFVVSGPGEYEIGGLYVKGLQSVGPTGKINTIYSVILENMNLCHLGGLSSVELNSEITEALGEIDVLFVPVWDGEVLDAAKAEKISSQLEPKIIIPLYKGPGKILEDKGLLAKFLKEIGEEDAVPLDKLTLKKKDLEGKEGDVAVLEAQV